MNTIDKYPVLNASLCTLCNKCVEICPHKAITDANLNSCAKCVKYCMTSNVPCKLGHLIFCHDLCDSCGKCVEVCFEGAIDMLSENEAKALF